MRNFQVIEDKIREDTIEKCGNVYKYSLTDRSDFKSRLYKFEIEMNMAKRTSLASSTVSLTHEKAIVLYEKLVKNLATPIDLAFIIEDEA